MISYLVLGFLVALICGVFGLYDYTKGYERFYADLSLMVIIVTVCGIELVECVSRVRQEMKETFNRTKQ